MKKLSLLAAVTLTLAISALRAADAPAPRIDPSADALLKKMCALLADSKSFTVESHSTTEELLASGQKIQTARNQKVAVRRPNAIASSAQGDDDETQFVYDGKVATLLNVRANTFSQVQVPATIDETLDTLETKYGVEMPLADLLFSDPYKALAGNVRSGQDLGTSYVFDTKCHHLAFRQEFVDWQIWIDAGDKPLPLKIVITFKESPANLEFTAFLSKWDLAANIPDPRFTFTPPPSAKKVDLAVPSTQPVDAR